MQRVFINYGKLDTPLKVEVSHRIRTVDPESIAVIDGIKTYTISELCELKASAYQNRDLYDLTFIIEHHYDELTKSAIKAAQCALEYKDVGQFDYLTQTQHDPLIDIDELADSFLNALDKVGLTQEVAMEPEEPCAAVDPPDEFLSVFSGAYGDDGGTRIH